MGEQPLNIDNDMDAYAAAEAGLWAHFGLEPPGYAVDDHRAHEWSHTPGRRVTWWEGGVEYVADIWGAAEWATETHTLFVLRLSTGGREAVLFLNSKRLPAVGS